MEHTIRENLHFRLYYFLLSLGYCQKKKLPSVNFKFVDKPEEVARDIIANYKPEDNTGYIMKVDLVS